MSRVGQTVDSAAFSDDRQGRALAVLAGDARMEWRRFTIEQFASAALYAQKRLFVLQPKEIIVAVVAVVMRRFEGGGASWVNLEVGTAGNPSAFLPAVAVNVPVVGQQVFYTGPIQMGLVSLETSATIRYRLSSDVALNALTSGVAVVNVLVLRL